jgi:hypothetical protein
MSACLTDQRVFQIAVGPAVVLPLPDPVTARPQTLQLRATDRGWLAMYVDPRTGSTCTRWVRTEEEAVALFERVGAQ